MHNFNGPFDPRLHSPAASQFKMSLANIQAQLSQVMMQMTMAEIPEVARHNLCHQRTALLNQFDEVIEQQTAFWKATFAQPGGPQYRTAGPTPVPAWAHPWNAPPSWGGLPHVPVESLHRTAPNFHPPQVNPRWDPSVIDTTAREVSGDQGQLR